MIRCYNDIETAKLSTLRAGGRTGKAFRPEKPSDLDKILVGEEEREFLVLGGLSNVLMLSGGTDKTVILTDRMLGHSIKENVLFVSAGERLIKACRVAEENGLSGLENLCGIPGTVGGALMGNSGSYGSTVSDALERVYLYRLDDGELEELTREEIAFSYRRTNLRRNVDFIIGAKFRLYPYERKKITARMQEVQQQRASTQPKGASLGSVFRKANDVSAGYYIEQAGLKGYTLGGMKFSEIHANFIINTGDGTPEQYLALVELAERAVYERFGITLTREVIIIGERGNAETDCGGVACD